jgi:hypothetical protein
VVSDEYEENGGLGLGACTEYMKELAHIENTQAAMATDV